MKALVAGMILIPLVDQTVKMFVRNRIGRDTLSLGFLGEVRLVQTQVWSMRALGGISLPAMWMMWIAAASASIVISMILPAFGWSFGLLLGGALSHALETSFRGSICDYVCLRFWPAFNLADIALTLGMVSTAIELVTVVS